MTDRYTDLRDLLDLTQTNVFNRDDVRALLADYDRMRDALETIAAYPHARDQEMSTAAMRKIVRAALQSQDRKDTFRVWHNDPETDNSWDTSCRQLFELYDGTPTENGMKFCCYCGGSLVEHIDHARRIEGKEMTTPKLIKDGAVAVLVSPGFGAGWSTWDSEHEEQMLFDPTLAQMIMDGKSAKEIHEFASMSYPDAYLGGLDDVVVEWVPVGSRFMIQEYDGSESLTILGPDYGFVA